MTRGVDGLLESIGSKDQSWGPQPTNLYTVYPYKSPRSRLSVVFLIVWIFVVVPLVELLAV